ARVVGGAARRDAVAAAGGARPRAGGPRDQHLGGAALAPAVDRVPLRAAPGGDGRCRLARRPLLRPELSAPRAEDRARDGDDHLSLGAGVAGPLLPRPPPPAPPAPPPRRPPRGAPS